MANNLPIAYRKGHVIRTVVRGDDGKIESYSDEHFKDRLNIPSNSAAKRASRKLQEANGGLGMGYLRLVEKLPEVGQK